MTHRDEDFICIYCDSENTVTLINGLLHCLDCGGYADIEDAPEEDNVKNKKPKKMKDGDLL